MIKVEGLIWDEWNKEHITKQNISVDEVEEICRGNNEVVESYRKRILITGRTKRGRILKVVLSPEDRNLQGYGRGIYYTITAFEGEV